MVRRCHLGRPPREVARGSEAQPGKRPLLVTLPHNVQTYDIDFANHVNNQVYVRWLEDLRMELLR